MLPKIIIACFLLFGDFLLPNPSLVEAQSTEAGDTDPPYETTYSPVNCGFENYLYPGEQTFINSPNYPNSYSNNANCVWRLRTNQFQPITIDITPVALYSTCCDSLEFRDGDSEYSPLLYRYNYSSPNRNYLYSYSGSVYIRFVSDYYGTAKGFHAYINALPTPDSTEYWEESTVPQDVTTERHTEPQEMTTIGHTDPPYTNPPRETTIGHTDPPYTTPSYHYCNWDYYKDFGYFSSPQYPYNYLNNAHCVWTFNVNHNKVIQIDFHGDVNIETGHDYLEIRDGPYSWSPVIAHITGWNISVPYIRSSSNSLWAQFYSDSSVTGSGFFASFTALYSDHPPTTEDNRPSSPRTTTTAPPVVVGHGVVINNNNNMFVNFFDWAKLGSWLSQLKEQLAGVNFGTPDKDSLEKSSKV